VTIISSKENVAPCRAVFIVKILPESVAFEHLRTCITVQYGLRQEFQSYERRVKRVRIKEGAKAEPYLASASSVPKLGLDENSARGREFLESIVKQRVPFFKFE
jgi:hypothetical protein